MFDKREGSFAGSDIAADNLKVRVMLLDPLHAVKNTLGVTVSGVDDDNVNACVNELFNALFGTLTNRNSSAGEELALSILGGERMIGRLGNVLNGHEAGKTEVLRNNENTFETMTVHQVLGFFKRSALHSDEAFTRRHDFTNRNAHAGFKAEVTVCDHAEHRTVFSNHGQTRDAVFARESNHVAHEHFRPNGNRFGNNAGFMALHLSDFSSLLIGSHILVNKADAAFLSERNRELGFSDRIHGG